MALPRYRVLTLDDVEAVPGPASLPWRALRAELGVRAFGVSSFVGNAAGDDVVEPHRESADGRGHQELYVVMRGAARFTLDGETFDAPAGTFVSVPDASVHRHAVAVEPGTEVVAFGGDPVFQPAGDEWMWRVRALLPDRVERARSIADAGLAELPGSPGVMYARALVAAADGQAGQAREWLARAVEVEPRLREVALAEEQLAALID